MKRDVYVLILVLLFGMIVLGGRAYGGLIGHWKLDEGSGPIASDSAGNRYGKIYDAQWTTGRTGGALELGKSGYLGIEGIGELNDFTFSMWVNAEFTGYCALFSGRTDVERGLRLCVDNANSFEVVWERCVPEVQLDVEFPRNRWIHVAVTRCDSTVTLYIDGRSRGNGVASGPANYRHLQVGSEKANRSVRGRIDDVRVYDHGLSAEEIVRLYVSQFESSLQKLILAAQEAGIMFGKGEHGKTIAFIETKIGEYEEWKKRNPKEVELSHELYSSDLYFLSAKAKARSGVSSGETIAAYKSSVSRRLRASSLVAGLIWLGEKISDKDYGAVVGQSVRTGGISRENVSEICSEFELSDKWSAFRLFLDAVLCGDQASSYATGITAGLKKDGVWSGKFLAYCGDKSELRQYFVEVHKKRVEAHMLERNFTKASEICSGILKRPGSIQDKVTFELMLYECLFRQGRYKEAILALEGFITRYKDKFRKQVNDAILMKGQCYVQSGDVGKALSEFVKVIAEYPESEEAPEAGFFVGYCHMLDGKFDEAVGAFELVLQDYPGSSFANKASLCLERIRYMAK